MLQLRGFPRVPIHSSSAVGMARNSGCYVDRVSSCCVPSMAFLARVLIAIGVLGIGGGGLGILSVPKRCFLDL